MAYDGVSNDSFKHLAGDRGETSGVRVEGRHLQDLLETLPEANLQ